MKEVIDFLPDGTVETCGVSDLVSGPEIRRTRASRIVPVSVPKRIAFYLIRVICGERGRAAEWTRSWKGPWVCHILGTRRRFYNQSRQACVRWEIKQINAMRMRDE